MKNKILSYKLEKNESKDSKILLCMNNNRNLDLLSRFLETNYLTYKNIDEDVEFDLILVDRKNYQLEFNKLKSLKKQQEPLFLPLILLHKMEDTVDYTVKMMNIF